MNISQTYIDNIFVPVIAEDEDAAVEGDVAVEGVAAARRSLSRNTSSKESSSHVQKMMC